MPVGPSSYAASWFRRGRCGSATKLPSPSSRSHVARRGSSMTRPPPCSMPAASRSCADRSTTPCADTPTTSTRHRHPSRAALRERQRSVAGAVDAPRRPNLGAFARCSDRDGHRHIRESHRTGQRSAGNPPRADRGAPRIESRHCRTTGRGGRSTTPRDSRRCSTACSMSW